ncbi:hypothetical protein FGRMN_2586 [Fusarium graminum]|nr:hypothetical protein FGRMN_2586 [Fusarium graminum]
MWRIITAINDPIRPQLDVLYFSFHISLSNSEATHNLTMASLQTLWGPMARRLLRVAVEKTTNVVRTKFVVMTRPLQSHLTLRTARVARQPIHPVAVLRQQKRHSRWFSSSAAQNVNRVIRRFVSSEPKAARFDRSRLPNSNTSRRVAQFSGRAPFANALRPNLTGGAFPRSAGGYSLGGSARYFSHTPVAPAQVVQNVSQAMRAFFLSGQKLRYDGLGPRGDRQYRAVSPVEDQAMHKLSAFSNNVPGSFVDFHLSPTVTALSPLAAAIPFASETSGFKAEAAAAGASLNTEGFLDVLSSDFGRALQDLEAINADLRRLAVLGDLPVLLEKHNILRVRFPGVDAETIERLCDDIGIQRGVVGQDLEFNDAVGVPVALRFPFAPDSGKLIFSPSESRRSLEGYETDEISTLGEDYFVQEVFLDEIDDDSWLAETDGYETTSPRASSMAGASEDYEGLEGIYRFLEECDQAKGRVGQVN